MHTVCSALVVGGDDLPTCGRAEGHCRHYRQLFASMETWFGDAWRTTNVAEFLFHSGRLSQCPMVSTLRYQVFWHLATNMDDIVVLAPSVDPDPTGMTILQGMRRCRRLTATYGLHANVSIEKSSDTRLVVAIGKKRDKGAHQAEKLRMSRLMNVDAKILAGERQIAVTMDCTGTTGRELMSLAWYSHRLDYAAWTPLQDSRIIVSLGFS
jgi:hypothetical protein